MDVDDRMPLIEDACPVCGALLGDEDLRCPRCGADVSRDRRLHEPRPASPEAPVPGPERTETPGERIEPPGSRDPEQRKPAYESGLRPPIPDEG